jgi:glycosyltransferase involved in cell wall biosynthesis
VAVLAPISWRTPPRHYGPWELFASLLTEGLVARGHDVTLFATGDSRTAAQLCWAVPIGWSEDSSVDPKVAECLHISQVFERAADFDVIHNSFDFLPLTYSRLVTTPVVTTIHGFSSERIVAVYEKYDATTGYVATIHHGIDTDRFELQPEPGRYLAFFGRIHPHKGTVEAIETAERAGLPLLIAGIVQDEDYFTEEVAPRLDGDRVAFLGPLGAADRSAFLGGALALLHLISFDEPFGYSVVEAMACGTPVIAFDRGSMRELIDDGVSGALASNVDEAVAAVERVRGLDRPRIRAIAVERFGVDRMVEEYVGVYRRVIDDARRT